MELALNSATFIKLPTWLSDFVSASVQCSFANDRWRFSPFVTIKFTHHFFDYYFPSWKFALGSSSSFPDWNARIVHTLIYTETSIALQSQWYTRPSGFLTPTVWKFPSQPDQKIQPFLFAVLFSLLCMYEVLASSPSKMYLSYMRLNIVPQVIIFTENVENASLFLSETCLYKLSNTNVIILYKIVRYCKDLGIAGYLPTARESYDSLSLQSEKFCHRCAVPWSTSWRHGPAFKSTLKL